MKEWFIEAIKWVATVTDAYFATPLPKETWDLFIDTCANWISLGLEYFAFIMQYIPK